VQVTGYLFISGVEKRYLSVSILICEREVFFESKKIKYCPMCGRRL